MGLAQISLHILDSYSAQRSKMILKSKFSIRKGLWSLTILLLVIFSLVQAGLSAEPQESPLDRGKALIQELGCTVCHDIKEHDTSVREEAPNLTFEGEIVRRDWLFAFLKKPYQIRPAIKGRMPDFRLTEREALAITEYLGSLVEGGEPVAKELRYPRKGSPQEVEAAKKLITKDYFNCFNCHIQGDKMPAGKSDEWAPDLTRVRGRINPDFLFKWFQGPDKYRPGIKMPAYLADKDSGPDDILGGDEMKQAAALRDYVFSLGKAESFPGYAEAKEKFPDVTIAEGRSLTLRLNCVGCHEIAVLPEGKKIGPNLTHQGSRVRKDWLIDFLRSPYTIKPEYALMGSPARMPTFHFNDAELNAVVEYISRLLVDKEIEQTISPDVALAKTGEKLFSEKRCNNCHRIGDRPAGIGPDFTTAGKRLLPAWTINFIQHPSHYLDTRMPNLQVSAEEAKALAAYILGPKR